MKVKLSAKKLVLRKETIDNLGNASMDNVKGGACTVFETGCVQTIVCCTIGGPDYSCNFI